VLVRATSEGLTACRSLVTFGGMPRDTREAGRVGSLNADRFGSTEQLGANSECCPMARLSDRATCSKSKLCRSCGAPQQSLRCRTDSGDGCRTVQVTTGDVRYILGRVRRLHRLLEPPVSQLLGCETSLESSANRRWFLLRECRVTMYYK
jgi:hypothetical protein